MIRSSRNFETHPAKWMLWAAGPMPKSVKRLKSAGLGSLIFDPCGNTSDNSDFLGDMRRNVDQLRQACK